MQKQEMTIEKRSYINIDSGIYDDTMKCPCCEFTYENRADNSHEENIINSKHKCPIESV